MFYSIRDRGGLMQKFNTSMDDFEYLLKQRDNNINGNIKDFIIETEKIEYYYLHPFSRFPYYSQIIVSYLCQLFLSLAEQGTLSSVSSVPDVDHVS